MNKNELPYILKRHDGSSDQSLRAHNAADEFLVNAFLDLDLNPNNSVLYNDRFGFLSVYLNDYNHVSVITNKSQEKAIIKNITSNNLTLPAFSDPLISLHDKVSFAFVKLPKSLDLFELFLQHICLNSEDNVTVFVGFMTRHFSPRLISISEKYFINVSQSKAVKKARLLQLSDKRTIDHYNNLKTIDFGDKTYKQYYGVFSADHIDYATQFFLKHIEISSSDKKVLDLASGNGIIACELATQLSDAEFHLMDDSVLAVASAKLNCNEDNIYHYCNNDMSIFEDNSFDLIVTNPPFHFEYEININIPLNLFKDCHRCLMVGGSLQMVANKHLNYKSHLGKIFSSVITLEESEKFIIYKCVK